MDTSEQAEKSCFPRAVWTNEASQLTVSERKVHILDRFEPAEMNAKVFGFYKV
ncbi:hypothetical protein CES85_3271 (plasmid) [Ochrobactrum quorumnocens]|uniref:Uncharacterized protein n=1 Tax=Ochrobactrum quorumnocens TaxID=271865 RepID=A0A248UN96_9HYPH|nr:hypothetical protein CES85_3271 [[Ochrobactrum] quorumnocens]